MGAIAPPVTFWVKNVTGRAYGLLYQIFFR